VTTSKAERYLIDRLGSASTLLLSIHLALPECPDWCDGVDVDEHAIVLVGAHALRSTAAGTEYVDEVLEALRTGALAPGVVAVKYGRQASELIAETIAGPAEQILGWGPRGSGKSQAAPGAVAGLAERHTRSGHALPLKILWVHDSLKNARAKTAESLEQAWWGGCWQLRQDRLIAALVIGGIEYVTGMFVGSKDPDAAEGLRAECAGMIAEELLASLEDGGIGRRQYDLARSSIRLPTPHPVTLALSNPGSLDSWVYQRFIAGGGEPGTRAIEVPAADRLSPEEDQAQQRTFEGSPDLQARLGRGEWTDLILGEKVTPQFTDAHCAKARLRPVPNVRLWLGHDGGHTPTTVIGAHYQGSVLIYAALSSTQAGTRQHVQQLVRPWLAANAAWALRSPSTMLAHRYDPAMATGEQADIDQDPVRVLRELLGGSMDQGAVDWPGRIDPVLALLGRFNPYTRTPELQIDPIDGALLIRALKGMWIYPTVNGLVSRDLPVKSHPWSDLGDSLAYCVGGIAPSRPRRSSSGPKRATGVFSSVFSPPSSGYRNF
jgi:hypothetical protein